eukprot:scaffold70965_cov48-Phaeocystis_antarctica.AAC.3
MSSLTSPSSTSRGSPPRQVVEDWAERSCEANDRCLQELFRTVRPPVPHVRVRLGSASPGAVPSVVRKAWS